MRRRADRGSISILCVASVIVITMIIALSVDGTPEWLGITLIVVGVVLTRAFSSSSTPESAPAAANA